MDNVILMFHVFSALVVMYASFCRLSKTSHETLWRVRLAIWLMGSVAAVALFAPFIWAWAPDWLHVAILGAVGFLQAITSRQWHLGVPERFQRGQLCTRH